MSEIVVFTNGCFDVLHVGHLELLKKARELGTKLIVGINSDVSVRQIKGNLRPIVSEKDRAELLLGLQFVDEVIIFDDPTPERLIEEICPNILVKGGDWKENEIIGSDFVKKNGGKVISIPLKAGYSTSNLVDKILKNTNTENSFDSTKSKNNKNQIIFDSINQHQSVIEKLLTRQIEQIEKCFVILWKALGQGNKILICGNGGSAADAQHFAAELVGRFEKNRRAFPAVALTTDTSSLTAISNDFGFDTIFDRQLEALAVKGDVLVGLSTSGNSSNVISSIMKAREMGCQTIGMTGENGTKLSSLCDAAIMVPSLRTARIQESHITIIHIWCEMIEASVKSD